MKNQVLTFKANGIIFHVVNGIVTLARNATTGRFVKLNTVTQAFNRVLCAAKQYVKALHNHAVNASKMTGAMYDMTCRVLLNAQRKLGFTRNNDVSDKHTASVTHLILQVATTTK